MVSHQVFNSIWCSYFKVTLLRKISVRTIFVDWGGVCHLTCRTTGRVTTKYLCVGVCSCYNSPENSFLNSDSSFIGAGLIDRFLITHIIWVIRYSHISVMNIVIVTKNLSLTLTAAVLMWYRYLLNYSFKKPENQIWLLSHANIHLFISMRYPV